MLLVFMLITNIFMYMQAEAQALIPTPMSAAFFLYFCLHKPQV